MIKYISINLTNEDYAKIKNKTITSDYILDNLFEVRVDKNNSEVRLGSDTGSDGSRYIMMNNEKDVCVAYHSSIATWQWFDDFGIDLESLMFKKIRRELGFERKY